MTRREKVIILGLEEGQRIESRILEEQIQKAIEDGYLDIEVHAYGQHGIGGRLWKAIDKPIKIYVKGSPGQRVGSMGFPNTFIEVDGPASDDVGWLNAGATIVVHGDATNGAGNAMAQGKIYIAGDIGARGMTMTKHNPRFDPPELWVLGSVGDSFAEFMAGGIAVICGISAHEKDNILGHRPCVGMVGGKIYFRGPHKGFSENDTKLAMLTEDDWEWLHANIRSFLKAIGKEELFSQLISDRDQWQMLVALKPYEKQSVKRRTIPKYKIDVWDKELGRGGLIGDLTDTDRSVIPVITTGELRRFVPAWENYKYLPPCQINCPTGIPVQKRWELIRKGKIDEAINLALNYTPFPATVCGYLCPNLCTEHCTRGVNFLAPVDVKILGKASLEAKSPKTLPATGKKIAIIGGGPAGLSVAWQLWLKGHKPVVFEKEGKLGGKIASVIPFSRIPKDIFEQELSRSTSHITHKKLKGDLTQKDFKKIRSEYDFVVIATGAQTPRTLNVSGVERTIPALDFLRLSKKNKVKVGKNIVVIGAGNVGCDVATEAKRLGAQDITLIDIQKPASFGQERKAAEEAGAKFLWPVTVKAITKNTVELTNGSVLPADTVVVSIGDKPDLGFLPDDIDLERGFIAVNDVFQTSDPHVFAIGDSVKPGLLTEAIGAGRKAADTIDARMKGKKEAFDQIPSISETRVKLEYYDPQVREFASIDQCAIQCASCGGCRDCGVCEAICPQQAISKKVLDAGEYEYVVDSERCIGCSFCEGACPCGIWEMRENNPIE